MSGGGHAGIDRWRGLPRGRRGVGEVRSHDRKSAEDLWFLMDIGLQLYRVVLRILQTENLCCYNRRTRSSENPNRRTVTCQISYSSDEENFRCRSKSSHHGHYNGRYIIQNIYSQQSECWAQRGPSRTDLFSHPIPTNLSPGSSMLQTCSADLAKFVSALNHRTRSSENPNNRSVTCQIERTTSAETELHFSNYRTTFFFELMKLLLRTDTPPAPHDPSSNPTSAAACSCGSFFPFWRCRNILRLSNTLCTIVAELKNDEPSNTSSNLSQNRPSLGSGKSQCPATPYLEREHTDRTSSKHFPRTDSRPLPNLALVLHPLTPTLCETLCDTKRVC